jgi:hypothetical protein
MGPQVAWDYYMVTVIPLLFAISTDLMFMSLSFSDK